MFLTDSAKSFQNKTTLKTGIPDFQKNDCCHYEGTRILRKTTKKVFKEKTKE